MPYAEDRVGFQRTDTSARAAYDMVPHAETIRQRVLALLIASPQALTSEEIGRALDLPYRSVPPRLSELRERRSVVDSGRRRTSSYGKQIICWAHHTPQGDIR